jgi:hypothetical protein
MTADLLLLLIGAGFGLGVSSGLVIVSVTGGFVGCLNLIEALLACSVGVALSGTLATLLKG